MSEAPPAVDAFISYSRKDAARVHDVVEAVDLAFAPGGDFLASADGGTVRLCDSSFLEVPAAFVCAQTGRSLTRAEWAEVVGSGVPYRKTC